MQKSIFFLVFGLLFVLGGPVVAQEIPTASQDKIEQVSTPVSETPNFEKLKKVSQLKSRAESELSKRVTKLGSLSDLMQNKKYSDISQEERSFLEGDILKTSLVMKDMREKARGTKDVAELKALLKLMYEDYRVLGIVYPRDRGLLALARNGALVKKYEQLTLTLEEKGKKLSESGKDTTKLSAKISEVRTHLKEASEHYGLAKSEYQALVPSDYPAKEKLEGVRTHNKEGIKHYDLVRAEYKKAVSEYKILSRKAPKKIVVHATPEQMKQIIANQKNVSTSSPSPTPATAVSKEEVVSYGENGFSPSSLTVKEGTTVKFKNTSSGSSMWIGSDPHPTHTQHSEFDQLKTGDEYSFTFTKKGTWGYHNHVRANARGTIVVE